MREFLRNALSGWREFITDGKFAAVYCGVLLYLMYGRRRERVPGSREDMLFKYGMVLVILLLFPVTAVMLMVYQTRFYDYIWLLSWLPLTLICAYGLTVLYEQLCENEWKDSLVQRIAGVTAGLAVLALCSCFNGGKGHDLEATAGILDYLTKNGNNDTICLWSPREVQGYARAADSRIRLPYGRNMWEAELNAYSYDEYTVQHQKMYQWMLAAETGGVPEDTGAVFQMAGDSGVNCILLPDAVSETLLQEAEAALQRIGSYQRGKIDGYRVYWIEAGEKSIW